MTVDEMRAAFAEVRKNIIRELVSANTIKQHEAAADVVLMAVVLVEEFMVDVKRVADAQEKIAAAQEHVAWPP